MNSFYKLFLLAIAIFCIAISIAKADTVINGFTFATQTDTIETLPEELPKTGAEWNGDCSSYGTNSYWKDNVCYTPKGAWIFHKETTTTSTTQLTCAMTTRGSIDNLIDRLSELRREYLNNDYLCKDIVAIEKELHMLVDSIWLAQDKTTTKSTTKETPKFIEFPAPQIKYITKTKYIKFCGVGYTYQPSLDACLPDISPRTGAR